MPTQSRGPRPCTYCPEPGADACVRTQGDGDTHIYAHQKCARAKGVSPLYVFTDEQPAGGSS
ncbi:hypothetical protein [Streptomyces gardneri]|uniref:hypothetical protein n=1 Tax=Streptomyces gardneri TaxID=66892 RepID=UPI0033C68261